MNVRMVNRSGSRNPLHSTTNAIPDHVEVVKGDAYNAAFCTDVARGATAVYQCSQPAYTEWTEKFPPLQAAILQGAAANGAKLIIGDNLYMYGNPDGKPLTEHSPWNAHTRKGHTRKAMAEAALAAHHSGKVRVAIARASDYFGPDYPIGEEFIIKPALTGGNVKLLGRMDVPHTFSYLPDVGEALATLGTDERESEISGAEVFGRVWHVPSPPPITQQDFVRLLEQAIGKPVKTLVAGPMMIHIMSWFNPMMRETAEMMYEWTKPFVMDSSAFEQMFGMTATPLAEALRATVEFYTSERQA
jgi:nucleoside-diphosphate-sugar epimerase